MQMSKFKTESFNIDHTKLKAPFIRMADLYSDGVSFVTKFDIRFVTPNTGQLTREAMHTIEHLFAEAAHSMREDVIDFSPMGCGTGFYLTVFGRITVNDIEDFIISTFQKCFEAEDIPAVNEVQCGNYRLHDLAEAKKAIFNFISNYKEEL